MRGEYYTNRDLLGPPHTTRVDRNVDFNWWQDAPVEGMNPDSFGVRWTGYLLPPETGTYAVGVRIFGGVRLYLEDSLIVEIADRHASQGRWVRMELVGGKRYSLRMEYWDRRPDASAQLIWSAPEPGLKRAALEAAREADVVVAVMGLSPRLEGEEMEVPVRGFAGGDRVDIGLPDAQGRLLRELVAIGRPLVLVLLSGSAVAIPWEAEHVPAILQLWYPGQDAGRALADVLFGEESPAGRLPVTFYRSVEQLPPFTEYAMQGRTYRYFTGKALFPFGHGLSYTKFTYGSLQIPAGATVGETVRVSVEVTNAGDRAGDEVVQLYVKDLEASAPVPVRSLEGFRRIRLLPGEHQQGGVHTHAAAVFADYQ